VVQDIRDQFFRVAGAQQCSDVLEAGVRIEHPCAEGVERRVLLLRDVVALHLGRVRPRLVAHLLLPEHGAGDATHETAGVLV